MRYCPWTLALGLVLIGCGSSTAETLLDPDSSPADSGAPDVAPDTVPSDAPSEVAADVGADADLDAPETSDVVEPVANPLVPPDVEVTTWSGKLPPGGMLALAIEVTRPAEDPPQGELYPLVVFAHGFQVGEDMYRKTMTHLAQFGYVTASVDYESSLVDQDHHAPVEALGKAIDMLTQAPPLQVGAVADPTRVVAAGHSLGAKGAVWLALEDPRISALVALDPVDDDPSPLPFPSDKRPSITPEKMGDLKVPSLFVGGVLSPTGQQPCAPSASNACRFFESVPAGTSAWLAVLDAFGHMQFLDAYDCPLLCGTCPRGDQAEHETRQAVFRGLAVAFLELHLRQKSGYLSWIEGADRAQLETDGMLLDPPAQTSFCTVP